MKKAFRIFILLPILYFISVIDPAAVKAAVTLPWSTTFNCADWDQSVGLGSKDVNCDGISGWGGWGCSDSTGSKVEQITSAANNPSGGGGKGLRHWEGDGQNNNSGGMSLSFTSVQNEVWVRWYMRYEKGFKWNPLVYEKWLLFDMSTIQSFVPGWYSSDSLQLRAYAVSSAYSAPSGNGWTTVMGGSTSDGAWHYYEVHAKMDTNGSNGVAEIWIDGVKRFSRSDINFGTKAGWISFLIAVNQDVPANGRCMAVDYDDLAVSTTGYIGPISDGTTPNSPPGVGVK